MRPACSAALLAVRTGCTRQRAPVLRAASSPRWTAIPPVVGRTFAQTPAWQGSAKPAQRNNDDKLLELVQRWSDEYAVLAKQIPPADDAEASMQHAKQMRELEPVAMAWKEYEEITSALDESRLLLDDPDATMRTMAEEEIGVLESQANDILATRLPSLLLQPSSTSALSAILELKAGVGGDEASLFVDQVSRMYTRYANDQHWKCEILSKTAGNAAGLGGLKEITIKVVGEGAFGDLRYERGVHRVQRVPETESAGRVHTSTIAVVVLPVLENNGGSDDVVDEKDVKTEVMRSRGAGGQHVNKTESAVRLTHIPTGISVSMQDSRSQHQNKAWAWQILRARLLDRHLAEQQAQRRAARRDQVKGMDRSDKVRTYNFPQDRVTDHRIGLTLSGLEGILEGEGLGYIIQELKAHQQSLRMENLLELGEDIQD